MTEVPCVRRPMQAGKTAVSRQDHRYTHEDEFSGPKVAGDQNALRAGRGCVPGQARGGCAFAGGLLGTRPAARSAPMDG